uniref:Ig-like domain-containing protein n=1 Tax=Neogobius melanostomus TaxID=47308 RepID=A0A8C6UU41_9GOBI
DVFVLWWITPLLNTFVSTGVKSETLTQPDSVTVQPGHTLSIPCTISYTGYNTAWIRQPAGKALEWIGYNSHGSSGTIKDSLKGKFSIDHSSSNTLILNGNNMQPGDSAVYYCAKLAQSLREYEELYKNN